MPSIKTPQQVLTFQNNIEKVYVSNYAKQRKQAIIQALESSSSPAEVARKASQIISITMQQGFNFIWQQGLYGGLTDAENDVNEQATKGLQFSTSSPLSYGLNEIIEFSFQSKESKNRKLRSLAREIEQADQTLGRLEDALNRSETSYDLNIAARYNMEPEAITNVERQQFRQELFEQFSEEANKRERLVKEFDSVQQEEIDPTKKRRGRPPKKKLEVKEVRKNIQARLNPEGREPPQKPQEREEQPQAELTPEQRERQSALNKLRRARGRKNKTQEKIQALETRVSSDNLYRKSLDTLNLTTQKEINKTLSNRYSAIHTASEFSTIYLNKRQEVLTNSEVKINQEVIKNVVGEYVAENKTEKNQEKLLRKLANEYRGQDKAQSKYNNALENIDKKRRRLNRESQIGEQDLVRIDDELNKLYAGIAEGKNIQDLSDDELNVLIARQEKEQGRITPETKESLRGVAKRIRGLKQERKRINDKIVKKEGEVDAARQRDLSAAEEFDAEAERLVKLRDSKNQDAIIDEVFPDLSPDEKTPAKLKEARRELAKRLVNTRSRRKQLELSASEKQRQLDDGDFDLRDGKRQKTRLNPEEQAEIAKLLDLKSDNEIAKLNEPMTDAQLSRLQDRLNRKKDIFRDEESIKRATRLAATETSAAYNLGRLFSYKNNSVWGPVKYVQVITEVDDRRSIFCASLDRRIFLLDDVIAQAELTDVFKTFPNTRKSADHPENKAINPSGLWIFPAHPNCRSYYAPVYSEDDKQEAKEDNEVLNEAEKILTADQVENRGVKVKQRQAEKMKLAASVRKEKARQKLKIASKVFDNGLRYLVKRFTKEGLVQLTTEDLKKDDSALVATLVAGTAVLSATTMAYFFMKSNLRQAINDYAKELVSDGYKVGAAALGEMTKSQAVKLAQSIAKEVGNIPKSAVEDFVEAFDPKLIQQSQLAELELETVAKRGEAGFALAMDGIPIGKVSDSLVSEGQIKIDGGNSFRNKLYGEMVSRSQSEINTLRREALNTVGEAFGDLGLVDDIKNISSIELGNFDLQGAKWGMIKYKKGSPRFINPRRIEEALNEESFIKNLKGLQSKSARLEKVLTDLDDTLPADSNPLLKKKIKRELGRVNTLKALSSQLPNKVKRVPLTRDLLKGFDEVIQNDQLNVQSLKDFQVGISRLNEKANLVIAKIEEYLPPKEVLSIEPKNVTNLTELEYLEEKIKASIKLIERDFISSAKNPKELKVKSFSKLSDINDDLILLRQISSDVKSDSVKLEYRPTLEKLDGIISETVLNEYKLLQARAIEVEKRIKELR
jgi:hypothetical protein